VHFPSRKETQAATLVVIVSVTVVGLYLGVVDVVLSWVIHRVLH
jgi:preprotein translocase SecE subunit